MPCHSNFTFCQGESASWSAEIRLPVFLEGPRIKHEFITWILFYRVSNVTRTPPPGFAGSMSTEFHGFSANSSEGTHTLVNHVGKNPA